MAVSPTKTVTNPRIAKLIELEVSGRIKPEHQKELDTYRAQGLAPKGSGDGTESERTAAFLATRVADELTTLGTISTDKPDAMKPSILAEGARGLFGDTAANYINSPDRQRVEASQENLLDAALTLGTGAAYNKEQLTGYRKAFFPQLGDGDDVIKDKKSRLQVLLQAARVKAGTAAPSIDKALAAAGYAGEAGALKEGHLVSEEGPGALAEHLIDKGAGLTGQEAPPERLPDGKVRVKGADGSYSTFENQRAYDESVLERQSGGRDTPAFRAAYKAKFGEDPGITVDVVGGRDPTKEELEKERGGVLGDVDAFVRGAVDVPTMGLGDELSAAATTVFSGGTMKDNLRYERGVDRTDEKINPYSRFSGQLTGALALPSFGARTPGALAGVGAGYGAGYGFGSSEGGIGERIKGAGVGGAVGALTGYGAGTLAARIAARGGGGPRLPPGGADAVAIARAGDQEGVALSRPLVDPSVRTRMAYLESSPGSGGPVRAALNATAEGIENRAGALGGQGVTQEGGALGQRIQDAGSRFIQRSRGVRNQLYDRAAQMAGNAEVQPTEALRVLDEHIADLSRNANTNAPTLNYLQEVRADLTSGAKTLADIRDLRTNLRGNISQRTLMHTPAERISLQVLDAARTDIQRDLGAAAPAAVRAYQRADRFNAERSSEIRQVVQRVIGREDDRLGGEQVLARIRSMAGPNGDSGRLARMVDKLNPEERADYTATIAASLGRRSPEEGFSPALFINNVRGISPAARRTIFGPEGARSIENLRLLAEAHRDTVGALNNSRSGVAANWGAFLRNIGSGGTLGTLVGGPTGGATGVAVGTALSGIGAATRNLSARALMSPNMSRWLASAPRQATPSAIAAHIARLSQVAARDPAIASETLGLQKALQAMNDNVPLSRAAASGPERNDQKKRP